MPAAGNSYLASPVGSSARSGGRHSRETTRSPFARADSQATLPEEGLPAHNSVHPSLQPSSSDLANAISTSVRHIQADNASSGFGTLPSTFFRSAHQRAEQAGMAEGQSVFAGLTGGHPMTSYRNPDLTLPPPLNMNSPTSPFFRPISGADQSTELNPISRSAPTEPSPFLPPIMGTPALFDSTLSYDRHTSRTSVSSRTSDFNLGKEEEAAANVLLALSSPEVMTPWQPASNAAQSLASLDRWSLDQGAAVNVTAHTTSTKNARERSESPASSSQGEAKGHVRKARRFETAPVESDRYASKISASRSSSAPEQTAIVAVTATTEEAPVSATIRMRMTAMDFLEGPVSMRFS
jgi:hypothetical protein